MYFFIGLKNKGNFCHSEMDGAPILGGRRLLVIHNNLEGTTSTTTFAVDVIAPPDGGEGITTNAMHEDVDINVKIIDDNVRRGGGASSSALVVDDRSENSSTINPNGEEKRGVMRRDDISEHSSTINANGEEKRGAMRRGRRKKRSSTTTTASSDAHRGRKKKKEEEEEEEEEGEEEEWEKPRRWIDPSRPLQSKG